GAPAVDRAEGSTRAMHRLQEPRATDPVPLEDVAWVRDNAPRHSRLTPPGLILRPADPVWLGPIFGLELRPADPVWLGPLSARALELRPSHPVSVGPMAGSGPWTSVRLIAPAGSAGRGSSLR